MGLRKPTHWIDFHFFIRRSIESFFLPKKSSFCPACSGMQGLSQKGIYTKKRIRLMFVSDNRSGQSSGCGRQRVFFGYRVRLQVTVGRDTDGLFIILARAQLERVFFLYLKKSDRDLIPFFSLEFLYVPLRRANGAFSSSGY